MREWQSERESSDFMKHCQRVLGLAELPTVEFSDDHAEAARLGAMAYFDPANGHVWCLRGRRLAADWQRSLAHELVHWAQLLRGERLDGSTGSPHENEANALAGQIMREWGSRNPRIFD